MAALSIDLAVSETDPSQWDADTAIAVPHSAHYRRLVPPGPARPRPGRGRGGGQDAFVALYTRWGRLRDPEAAAGYLRQAVINGSRSALRRRGAASAPSPCSAPSPTSPPTRRVT